MQYRHRDTGVVVDVRDGKVMDGGFWGPVSAGPQAPPKVGRGSSRNAWAAYAADQGVDVDDDMTRDDIIEAVEG
jgi:hypothetical protein